MTYRVLILIKGLGRGGAEQLLVSAAPHWDRSKFDYEVAYLLPEKNALVSDLEDAGVVVHRLPGRGAVSWIRGLRNLTASRGFDLIHAHLPYSAFVARAAFPDRGHPPIVYTEHGPWDHYRGPTYWSNALSYWRNDHVFAVSDGVRSSIRYPKALSFLSMPPVETLFHGLDSTSLVTSSDGVRDELGIPAEAPLVGMVANFRAQKRHDVLLYAALVVRDAVPDARFVLVGQGPLEEDMRRLAAELDLNGTVLFTGFRDDATRLAAAFDVFALPSAWEGLPIALLEAMWLGKPCVVSRVGGTSEVVEHETNALVVPPGDSYALATELIRVLKDRPLQERLGAGATTRARQFEIHHAVDRMEQVYQELLR